MLPDGAIAEERQMVTRGVRGDVTVKAPVVNPRPPTTAATGPLSLWSRSQQFWLSRPIPFGIWRTGVAVS